MISILLYYLCIGLENLRQMNSDESLQTLVLSAESRRTARVQASGQRPCVIRSADGHEALTHSRQTESPKHNIVAQDHETHANRGADRVQHSC